MVEPIQDVLFLVADQWRGDTLGHLGTPGVLTPNLDALAAEGVSFTNHWCQASPCGPSRRSLMTATEPRVHGQWTNDEVGVGTLPTLGEAVRAAGITPALIGYTDTPSSGWDPARGWQATDGRPASEAEIGPSLYDPAFDLVRPFFWQLGFPSYRDHLRSLGYELGPDMLGIYPPNGLPDRGGVAPSAVRAEHSDTAWLTEAALDLLDRSEAPMLLHLNWLRPHPPLVPPPPYHRLIDPDEVGLPNRTTPLADQHNQHPFFTAAGSGRRQLKEYLQRSVRVSDVTETDDRHLRAAYYGLCAEVDHHLGRIVERLKASGRWDRTMVIFISDHGDALGDHWLYGRRGPFDGHFRVPCVIRDPRPQAAEARGTTVDRFTTNGDIMPTILDAIGADCPDTVDGRSLTRFLHQAEGVWEIGRPTDDPWRAHVRYEMDWSDHGLGRDGSVDRFVAVRTERFRYVEFNNLPPLLFDTVEDPAETTNRADDPSLATTEGELHLLARS